MQIRPKGDTGGQVSSKGGRARELLGVKIGPILSPGPLNAITDVPSVCVGMVQKFVDGPVSSNGDSSEKYARAGITAIGTRDIRKTPLFAGVEALQGSGELSGAHFIAESGQLATPILITGTQSVGAAYDGVSKATAQGLLGPGQMPVPVVLSCVAETYDRLSHPNSFTLGKRDVFETLQQMMKSEDHQPVKEGNVGGGTPMCSFGLKGGTGTSSRIVPNADGGSYTVGVLVQANHGSPINLTVDGVNVGRQLYEEGYTKPYYPSPGVDYQNRTGRDGDGSIIAVIATDAPLLPHQCKGLARRAGVGISRGGGGDGFFSGDIFIAFSTATPVTEPKPPSYQMIEPVSTYTINATTNETIDVLFRAAADATEEAVLNALCAAEELQGYNGRAYKTFPVQRVREILRDAGKDV